MPDPTCTSKQCECDPNPRLDRGVATPGVVRAAMEARRQQWQANRPWCAGQARLACRLRLGCAPHSPSTLPRGRGWALAAVGRRRLGQRRTCLPGPRAGDQPVLAALTSSWGCERPLAGAANCANMAACQRQEKGGHLVQGGTQLTARGGDSLKEVSTGCELPRLRTASTGYDISFRGATNCSTSIDDDDRPTDRPTATRADGRR